MSGTYRAAAVFACGELAAATAASAATSEIPAAYLVFGSGGFGFHPKTASHRAWCVRGAQS